MQLLFLYEAASLGGIFNSLLFLFVYYCKNYHSSLLLKLKQIAYKELCLKKKIYHLDDYVITLITLDVEVKK